MTLHPVTADLVPLLRNLVNALQPFAAAQLVSLHFQTEKDEIVTAHHPEELIPDLTQLLCRVLTFTPENHSVTLQVKLLRSPEADCLQLGVVNTGSNLSTYSEILKGMKNDVQVRAVEPRGTLFEMRLPMERSLFAQAPLPAGPVVKGSPMLKHFYNEMRKRLSAHFSDPVNLERAVQKLNGRDAAFLQKTNAVILAHLDQEGFDVKHLCKALALSRTQLYRRLVPIIKQSPARYVRVVRLQKAKEMLEAGDLSIGEVATRTGFQSQSHFTRIFTEHFGMRPSAFHKQAPKT